MTLEEAVASTQIETRHYAKRQYTWLRREAGLIWLDGFGETVDWQPWVHRFLAAPASV
jgi:tRNA A37 N6-isopentenylltransferase MiaA